MKPALFPAIALSLAVVILLPAASRAEGDDKRAAALLQLMAQTYAEAQSYSDTSTAVYRNPDGSEHLRVDYKIWFARPNDFRIDAESRSPATTAVRREVMWSTGAAARSWSTGKAVATQPKIKLIGSGMFGTYAYHIPTLLDESYGGARRLHELVAPELVGQENIEGVQCFHVRGTWEGDVYDVWLGVVDNLVHKIVAKYRDYPLEEIHRNITFNQDIPQETFRFVPEEAVPSAAPKTTATPPAKRK